MAILDFLHVSIADQQLYGFTDGLLRLRLPVSTARNGVGELNGSGCTPRGLHQVRARIGDGLPEGAVLRGRRWTGEVWSAELHEHCPGRDWILSRILWLSGCEPGVNRMGSVDTFRRYIYIHGTPDCEQLCSAVHEKVPLLAAAICGPLKGFSQQGANERLTTCFGGW